MITYSISARSLFLTTMIALSLSGATALAAPQTANVPEAGIAVGGYRIAGTVVGKTDGHPLAQARISVRDVKGGQPRWLITSGDGKVEVRGLAAGNESLVGQKRGF